MTEVQYASARELERRRSRARRLARPDDELPIGWRLDHVRPGELVGLYSRLRLRPGLRLVALLHFNGGDGRGWPFAVPVGEANRLSIPADKGGTSEPVPPRGALPHFMEAIEGDGSLRAFIQASIVRRELGELGAYWHGLRWSTHTLLGPARQGAAPVICGQVYGPFEGAMTDHSWEWLAPMPTEWRPGATRRKGAGAIVCFYSYDAADGRIYEHVDEYPGALGLVPERVSKRELARGPGGFVF